MSSDYILLRTGSRPVLESSVIFFQYPLFFVGFVLGTGFPREGFVTIAHILTAPLLVVAFLTL